MTAQELLETKAEVVNESKDKSTHVWRSQGGDFPCTPTKREHRDEKDGRVYVRVRTPDGDENFVPKDELVTKVSRDEPDRAEAERFLAALDPSKDARWCFQTFDDSKERRKARDEENKLRKKQGKPPLKDSLARWRYGTLAEHWDELFKLNARGAGIYVTINETDGTGRKKTNIRRIRALFVDLDGSPIEAVNNAELKPHIVVESSPNRFHAY